MLDKKEILEPLDQIPGHIDTLLEIKAGLESQISCIHKHEEPADASIWIRDGVKAATYYLVYRKDSDYVMAGNDRRRRIGRGPEALERCQHMIQMYDKLKKLNKTLADLKSDLTYIHGRLTHAFREADYAVEKYGWVLLPQTEPNTRS